MQAVIERIHKQVLDFKRIEAISQPMRELIEDLWPELANKLPPKANRLLSRPRFWDKAAAPGARPETAIKKAKHPNCAGGEVRRVR